jgi:hypothetical protein
MKTLTAFVALFLSAQTFAQDATPVATVNTLDPKSGKNRVEFLYPMFFTGKVVLKDSSFAETLMNYNTLTGQMLFRTPKGDTLALARPMETAFVVIGEDSFVYHDNSFLQKVTHNNEGTLIYVRKSMKYIGKEKKGPYGTYSSVSSANSNGTYTYDDNSHGYIGIDENHLYIPSQEFFISDGVVILPASKQNFYKLFPADKKALKDYMEGAKINFNDKDELMALLKYLKKVQTKK